VEEVVNSVAEYAAEADEPTLSGFLDQVTLAGREFGSPKDKAKQQNAVWLMTYHSAKGLEFPIVYMVGMEEGVLPHSRSLRDNPDDVDEERRLCYVGITRAQEELSLTLPLERMKWGKPRPTFPSRFLYELTGQADNPNRIAAINGARKELLRGKSAGGKGPPAGKGSSAQSGSKSGGNQGSGPKSGGSPPGNSRPAPRRSTG
jgi:DNA helicase II / ATP-dependent DNA helicase PcrA